MVKIENLELELNLRDAYASKREEAKEKFFGSRNNEKLFLLDLRNKLFVKWLELRDKVATKRYKERVELIRMARRN